MRSFSLLDTYDPSANSTGYPYKESILMKSPLGVPSGAGAVCLSPPSSRGGKGPRPISAVQIASDRPGHIPAGQAQDVPDAVWPANWDRLVAAAIARCGRALLLEALTAVDRLVVPRLEGNFRLLAAGGANSWVHLT